METAISAVVGELVSRFISFLATRYSGGASLQEKKLERLQQLLLRVQTVVEEADARYITNSGMLAQLQMLADAMYRGYYVLDTFRYRSLCEIPMEEVSESSALSFASPVKRFRTITIVAKDKALSLGLHEALERLETAVAHIAEFVVLLGGCDRILRRPYDTHLYIDNFMFGRHIEKQKLFNFLLQDNNSCCLPAVLPIIGQPAVWKKTLVAHVCSDDRVRTHFSSILHMSEDDLLRVTDCRRPMKGKILVVAEFISGVHEKNWAKFYSYLAGTDRGSKMVIVSRLKGSEKFGTVKPIFLNTRPLDEFSYLFKILAFGSANPAEHPKLVQIADKFSEELQSGWSLVASNVLADVMRRNFNMQFWLSLLNRCKRVVERNISVSGNHPISLIQQGHHADMTDMQACTHQRLQITYMSTETDVSVLPKLTFAELIVDPSARPKGEFNVVTWQSRLPPYASFTHFVPSCDQDMPKDAPMSGRKRRGVPL